MKESSLFDFEIPENNDFLVTNQFKMDGLKEPVYPDIVCYVNGIPLVVIECKSPYIKDPINQAVEKNFARYQSRGAGYERLMFYNHFLVATCGEVARHGTIGASVNHYGRWSEPYPLTLEQVEKICKMRPRAQEILIAGFNGIYDKMIEVITGRKQNYYVGVRGNTTRTFDIYFKSFDSMTEKIKTYTGEAELDYTLWTNDSVFLFEAKKAATEDVKRYLDIGWHKFAYTATRFLNYTGHKIYPVYFLRNPKQVFLFIFPQFRFHNKGVILNDKEQMTPVSAFAANL